MDWISLLVGWDGQPVAAAACEARWRPEPEDRTGVGSSRVRQSSQRRDRRPKRAVFVTRTWYGTEVTTVPLRNSSRPLRNRALWLWRSWPHQCRTTNSGITTVTMSFVPLGVELVDEPQDRPGQLPVRRVDDLERDVEPELAQCALDLLLLLLVGDDR